MVRTAASSTAAAVAMDAGVACPLALEPDDLRIHLQGGCDEAFPPRICRIAARSGRVVESRVAAALPSSFAAGDALGVCAPWSVLALQHPLNPVLAYAAVPRRPNALCPRNDAFRNGRNSGFFGQKVVAAALALAYLVWLDAARVGTSAELADVVGAEQGMVVVKFFDGVEHFGALTPLEGVNP